MARAKLRKLLPGAIEMVYDNYNALVIGFSPTERPSDAVLSLVIFLLGIAYVCLWWGTAFSQVRAHLPGAIREFYSLVHRTEGDWFRYHFWRLYGWQFVIALVPACVFMAFRRKPAELGLGHRDRRRI